MSIKNLTRFSFLLYIILVAQNNLAFAMGDIRALFNADKATDKATDKAIVDNKYYDTMGKVTEYKKYKLDMFREGNNTFYMRHAPKPDKRSDGLIRMSMIKPNLVNRPIVAKSACLSEIGREESVMMGIIFRDLKIDIHEFYSSNMCRAYRTAEIAFKVKPVLLDFVNYKVPMGLGPEYKTKWLDFFFKTSPPEGKNRIIIGHGGGKLIQLGFGKEINLDESGILVYNHKSGKIIHLGKNLEQWAYFYYLLMQLEIPFNNE